MQIARRRGMKKAVARAITLGQLAELWMADVVGPKLKPRTAFDYGQLLAKHILPSLGRYTLAEIDREHVGTGRPSLGTDRPRTRVTARP